MEASIRSNPYNFYKQAIGQGTPLLFAIPLDTLRHIISKLGANDPAHFILKLTHRKFISLTEKMKYEQACENATKQEAWCVLDHLYPEDNKDLTLTDSAAKRGHLKLAQMFHEKVGPLTEIGAFYAAQHSSIALMTWTCSLGFKLPQSAANTAAKLGDAATLSWLLSHGCTLNVSLCESGASGGHIAILKFLREENGCKWDQRACAAAAQKGHLAALQWLRGQGCPWDEKTCYKAAGNGHLGVLQWARSQRCPWNEKAYVRALRNNHEQVAQWIEENKGPIHTTPVDLTPRRGRRPKCSTINRYPAV